MNEHKLSRKLIFALAFAFLLAVIVPAFILFNPSSKPSITSLVNLSIGKTTDKEVSQIPGVENKEKMDNGYKYTLAPSPYLKNNEIVTKDGKVVFAKISVSVNDKNYGTVQGYLSKFGSPDKTFTGSRYYGASIKTYVYSTDGFAIVGNPDTGTLYEIQKFQPLSVADYLKLYGQDIDETLKERVDE